MRMFDLPGAASARPRPHDPDSGRAARRAALAVVLSVLASGAHATNVTTYHYDNYRSGWNNTEQSLTPASVSAGTFGVLANVALDSRADAQPLVLTGVDIAGQGVHDVVYVATENDSVYALDAATGAQLLQVSLGEPVPLSAIHDRHDNMPMGIQSTPVIDTAGGTLYVLAFTYENSLPTWRIHALDVGSLADKVPSVVVSASNTLTDGTTIAFNAAQQRQRPALVLSSGNVYAAFGSFADLGDTSARGWVLGWQAGSLQPLAGNQLTNHRTDSTGTCWQGRKQGACFLSSIWMSGDGIAADGQGNLYFSTGNSDSGTYDGVTNIQESVVKLSPDLGTVADLFTPWDVDTIDKKDMDIASGGLALVPSHGRHAPYLVADGKSGTLYFLDSASLGGHVNRSPDRALGEYAIGTCWCGPSWFIGSDGKVRVVTSGGTAVGIWKVQNRNPALVLERTSQPLTSGQDPGFFTTISSNGTQADTAVIWAVARPAGVNAPLALYAFGTKANAPLFSEQFGSWPSPNANANIVPVVANGRVYAAAGNSLTIFGPGGNAHADPPHANATEARVPGHEIFGRLRAQHGTRLLLVLRGGETVVVDASAALARRATEPLIAGRAYAVDGTWARDGLFAATLVFRVKDSPSLWLPDK